MRILIAFLCSLFILSCNTGPREIQYGDDVCEYCKMTVVSKQHAAQAVTYKGKIFMFDAIECLLHYQIDNPSQSFTHLLINDFSQAGKLIEAQSSTYLISQAMPSPMGAFLNGFEDKNVALEFQKKKGGEVYNWNSLLKKVKMDKGSMDMDLNE